MPHDPRTGYYGHQLSPLDQQQQVRPDDNTSSARGRRRRALGDDGTGGTRVIDLLSKHGKAPGPSTGSHRRHAEPSAPVETNGSGPNGHGINGASYPRLAPVETNGSGPNGHGTNGSGPHGRNTNGPSYPRLAPVETNGSGPNGHGINGPSYPRLAPAERSRPGIQPAEPQQERPPRQDATRPAVNRPRLPRIARPPSADPRPAPPPAAPPAAEPRPSIPPTAPPAAGSWTPPGTQRGLRPAPPPERRSAPRRPGETSSGRWPQPAPPRPNGFAVRGGVAAASGPPTRQPDVGDPEATRIAEALNGKLAAPTDAPPPGRRPAEPQPAARPGRPVSPSRDAAGPPRGGAAQPEVAPAPNPPQEERNPETSDADWDLDDEDIPGWEDNEKGGSAEVKAIDATLARFSAVHDELAAEEAKRRKRLSWLMGKRKEPELGEDMPFDFVEGRDAQASRREWKKKRRRRKVKWIVAAVVIIVALAAGAVFAMHLLG